MDSHLIIHVASDTIDSYILTLAQIAIILSAFSTAACILFLIDYFRRHGWQYRHRNKKVMTTDPIPIPMISDDVTSKEIKKKSKVTKKETKRKTSGAPLKF